MIRIKVLKCFVTCNHQVLDSNIKNNSFIGLVDKID